MKTKLHHLATISSGIYAKPELHGDVCYIQARDVRDDQMAGNLVPQLVADGKINRHFLAPGDLLIAAKGKTHQAVVYTGTPAPAVASTWFIVVRITDPERLLPPYLRWFLNLEATQKRLAGGAQGSALPVIAKADLEYLDIPLPTPDKQAAILHIEALGRQEAAILQAIQALKHKSLEQTLQNALLSGT